MEILHHLRRALRENSHIRFSLGDETSGDVTRLPLLGAEVAPPVPFRDPRGAPWTASSRPNKPLIRGAFTLTHPRCVMITANRDTVPG